MIFGTFDTPAAKEAPLRRVMKVFEDFGVKRVHVKKLAPNDNSKNEGLPPFPRQLRHRNWPVKLIKERKMTF